MTPVTHYEVYQVKYDRWALRQRFSAAEEERATQAARELEVSSGLAVQVEQPARVFQILEPDVVQSRAWERLLLVPQA